MLRTVLPIILILVSVAHCKLTPDPNFNSADFAGNWYISAYYSTSQVQAGFYSCATFNVTKGTLNRLTLAHRYINTQTKQFQSNSQVVISNPLNKGVLISTTQPGPQNNFVVTYFNSEQGRAVLINPAISVAFFLSKDPNPYANDFRAVIVQQMTDLNISINNVNLVFDTNCNSGNLHPVALDLSQLKNQFFINAIYSNIAPFHDIKTFYGEFKLEDGTYSVSVSAQYNNGKNIETISSYISNPDTPSVLINTKVRNEAPLVVLNSDAQILAVSGDGAFGFVLSSNYEVSPSVINKMSELLEQNGLSVDSGNYYVVSNEPHGVTFRQDLQ